jgi:ABC-type transporter Mla subunit MlaD
MPEPSRIDRIEATTERTAANLDRLTQVVATLAAAVASHDEQIEQLVRISEQNARNWEQLRREWQAYLNTIRPQ